MRAQENISKKITLGFILFVIWSAMLFPVHAKPDIVSPSAVRVSNNLIYLPVIENGKAYFISPSGDDNNTGRSEFQAWATFDRALNLNTPGNKLQPGDVLVLMDGVYYQSLSPFKVSGQPGRPITIRAQNDGKAIIDGQGVRIPVEIERYRASNYVIEGIVARNSSRAVYQVTADQNVFRRVSGYDANTDDNAHVFNISGDYNLIEDCVASGTGRKMVLVFQGDHNIVRRCFADWRAWDGRNWCSSQWPWGEGIEFYGANDNIMENSIAYGHTPRAGISVMSQYPQTANRNRILGTMAILSGMKEDGSPMVWGDTRPGPTQCTSVQNFDQWPALLTGIRLGESGEVRDNLLQDIFAWGSARFGLSFHAAGELKNNPDLMSNNRVNRATIVNNGLNNINRWGGTGVDAWRTELSRFDSIEDSFIDRVWVDGSSYTTQNGQGARLTHRYINGMLTDEPLWPWPMEARIQAELGISVTEMMTQIIFGTSNLEEIYP